MLVNGSFEFMLNHWCRFLLLKSEMKIGMSSYFESIFFMTEIARKPSHRSSICF